MRVVIDMQGVQTESRFHGIGRYTLSLAQAIVRNRGEHEIILALSGLFPETIEPIRAAFDGLLPQENIRIWHAPGPVRECEPGNEWRREVAERIREAFLAGLRPDVVLVSSLFEGWGDDAVTSVGVLDIDTPVVVTLHAPIPPVNPETSLKPDPRYARYYQRKIEYLKRANQRLAIGATVSGVPEVIDLPDALFDPYDEGAIARKIAEVLVNDDFRTELERHGLEQAKTFSWDESARRAIAALERVHAKRMASKIPVHVSARRPKLAYVSPMPPERSGIADYSAELLPELAKHYEIEVVVAQEHVVDAWVQSNCPVRDAQWLRANAHRMDRVLYHFGNSPFHRHMVTLAEEAPGTVVLHDFFLGGLLAYLERHDIVQHAWVRALYHAHGYSAVRERYHAGNVTDVNMKYPVNLQVLQHAQGVIVHSEYSRKLAGEWYGEDFAKDWRVIPLLRTPRAGLDRARSRAALGLKTDDFVVCSFGLLTPLKLNHRLLESWLHSRLAQNPCCVLVFVGENHGGEYGAQLLKDIRAGGLEKRIRITGWADMPTFRNYLAAADIAVQLRTLSRGETSAAVLDCMNHALPTIVNANGSIADLSPDSVWMLPDAFESGQLIEALETLWQDGERRSAMGKRAQELILTRHAPHTCAEQYAEAIEEFYARSQCTSHALTKAIAELEGHSPTDAECQTLAQTIAQLLPVMQPARQLLLDVSATCCNDLKTGIERVTRALVMALLESPSAGYRVEPVYLSDSGGAWHYRYARRYTLGLLECPPDALVDEVVEPRNGDVLLGLDLSGQTLVEAEAAGLFTYYRNAGVGVHFMVHDLLPVQRPECFPPGADENHKKWLQAVAQFDGAICVSKTVADDLTVFLKTNSSQRKRAFKIGWSHHGADVENSSPTRGLPKNAAQTLAQLSVRPSFLMVGTIEPRKGHLQTLEAFTQLWREGLDINLVIVGKEGWKGLPDDMRRTIPETVNRLRYHPELNKRLYWLEGISDEYLENIYAASTCLIAASEGEGFGLPLIEAAQHKLPIIARDIPVVREVAGKHAYYFDSADPQVLALAIREWLDLFYAGRHPKSDKMPWLVWRQSGEQLLDILLEREYDTTRTNNSSGLLVKYFPTSAKRLYIDVSVVCKDDFKTGIQRVTRSILAQLMAHPPEGYDIIPVSIDQQNDSWGYFWAKAYHRKFSKDTNLFSRLNDKRIEPDAGDIFLGLDLAGGYVVGASQQNLYQCYKNNGAKVYFVIYDLLPVTHPQFFSPPDSACHAAWLRCTAAGDGVICISKAVADEYNKWLFSELPERVMSLDIKWFHLGADVENSVPTRGLPDDANQVLEELVRRPTFLTVGTVEPRKAQAQVFGAFELLWREGIDANLVIVGKQGWMVEKLAERLRRHSELNKRLFWMEGASDEYLENIYAASTCLIAASEGEGFGLPLIEAAKHKLPIIARDIPVFREVAGGYAFYFKGHEPQALTDAVRQWLELNKRDQAPRSGNMPRLTWKQSAEQLIRQMGTGVKIIGQMGTDFKSVPICPKSVPTAGKINLSPLFL